MPCAGSRCLSIFTQPLNLRVLRAHADGALRQSELAKMLGWAPQSSLRAAVGGMAKLGVVEQFDTAGTSRRQLTPAGRELLPVADSLERWLEAAPDGSISLDDAAGYGTIRVLTTAWDSTVVRALSERPQTLLELSTEIRQTNYPALKRCLTKLRSTQLAIPTGRAGTAAYTPSDWLRRAVAPLLLAVRWERRFDADASRLSQIELEAILLLAMPLADFSVKTSGTCALAVLAEGPRSTREVAKVGVQLERGQLISCRPNASSAQDTWVLGSIDGWLEAIIDGGYGGLRFSGAKPRLAESTVNGLQAAFASVVEPHV